MSRRCPALAPLLLIASLLACGNDNLSIHTRLVDLTDHPGGSQKAPVATIGSESRPVFQTFTHQRHRSRHATAAGPVTLEFDLSQELMASERLFVSVRGTQRLHNEGWVALSRELLDPRQLADGVLTSKLALGELTRYEDVTIEANLFGLPPAVGTEVSLPAIPVPSDSVLEFGLGLVQTDSDQVPVAFEISACAGDDCELVFSERLDPSTAKAPVWRDRSISLESFANQEISFRFRTRNEASRDDRLSLPVWSNPTLLTRSEAAGARGAPRPSFVLISLDTLRADHLPTYGYPLATAPFIQEQLAARGTVFENMVAVSATTTPTHMAMFTATMPSVNGFTKVVLDRRLTHRMTTLAEAFRDEGFATGAVTENGAISIDLGFGRGFDTYIENKSPHQLVPAGHMKRTFEQGVKWLERRRERPFFLFLHTYQVHDPFTPANRFVEMLPADERPAELSQHEAAIAYDQEIRELDAELEVFFEAVEELELVGETVFVITADHGEEFLEHGFLGHGVNLYEEVLNVPLIFVGPKIPEGRRIEQPVSQLDLMPTLLDLAGIAHPQQVAGTSLVDLLFEGTPTKERRTIPIYSEAWIGRGKLGAERWQSVAQPTLSVRLGDRKLIRLQAGEGFEYRYYDLTSDPGAREDRYGANADEARDMRQLLDRFPAAARSRYTEFHDPDQGSAADGWEPTLDPEREEKLRALGYIE